MSSQNRSILIIGGVGIVFILAIALIGARYINLAPVFTLVLYAGLIVVTMVYAYCSMEIAKATEKQAKASVEMAEEMKEQRLAMCKPHIILEGRSEVRGKYFVREIDISIRNEGPGTAINVRLYIAHPLFKFEEYRHPLSISAGPTAFTHKFPVVEPSVEDDPGMPVDPTALAVANYEDTCGNCWHSTLELHWDTTSRDITPSPPQVAIRGHFLIRQGNDD